MPNQLNVWLLGEHVGTLTQVDGRLGYVYAPQWLERGPGVGGLLSQSLPLRAEPFDDRATRPFFAGLLPEGDKRRLVAQALHASRQNDFALLDGIGGECAGAVTLLEPGQTPAGHCGCGRQRLQRSLLHDAGRCAQVECRPGPNSAHRRSLRAAGATLRPPTRHRWLAARRPNHAPAPGRLLPSPGRAAKYQNEGGPDLAQAFALLRRATRPSAAHILALLDGVVFNALIGNHDAHGKNFSLLYGAQGLGSDAGLAPLYDALCTAVYPRLTDKMAMKIGGKYRLSELMARHWEQFARDAGLSPAQVKKRILGIAKRLPDLARENRVSFEARGRGHPILEQIVVLIAQRCALTIRRLIDKDLASG